VEVTLPVSNQELASQIGNVRKLISRNPSRFQFEGLAKIYGRSVIIRDLKALEAESSLPNSLFGTSQRQAFLRSP
jgi:hypothetical protein